MINEFSSDELKTIEEHSAIINKFKSTGFLDREDAIKKYLNFNTKYKDFYIPYESIAVASKSNISIQDASDDIIVGNLKAQFDWLTSKVITKNL